MAGVTYNTIVLKGDKGRFGAHEEARMSVAGYPGYLVMKDSDGKFLPTTVRGGKYAPRFLKENFFEGQSVYSVQSRTLDTVYAIGDLGFSHMAAPGEVIYATLKVYENVAKGDPLIAYGDGTLCKAASAYLLNNAADSATLTSWTTEVAFSNGTITIPKNTLRVGDLIRVRGAVVIPSTNSTDTIIIKVKIGSTAIITSETLNVTDNDIFVFDTTLVVRTIGASGTVVGFGTWNYGVAGTATARSSVLASTSIDTTAAITMTVTATASVSSSSNQAILRALTAEHVRAGSGNANSGSGGHVIAYADEALDLSAASADARVPVIVA